MKGIKQLRNEDDTQIAAESDGTFNNHLYSGVGKTPFQPSTQCTYTVVGNETPLRQILAIETAVGCQIPVGSTAAAGLSQEHS